MTREEGGQTLRHAARILQMKQVRRLGEDKSLGLREPIEQQFLAPGPATRLLPA